MAIKRSYTHEKGTIRDLTFTIADVRHGVPAVFTLPDENAYDALAWFGATVAFERRTQGKEVDRDSARTKINALVGEFARGIIMERTRESDPVQSRANLIIRAVVLGNIKRKSSAPVRPSRKAIQCTDDEWDKLLKDHAADCKEHYTDRRKALLTKQPMEHWVAKAEAAIAEEEEDDF